MSGFERLPSLTVGVAGLEPRVDGTPIREHSWEEIAAAMGHLTRSGSDLMRGLYLHDVDAWRRTQRRLRRVSSTYGMTDGLRDALVQAALQAFVAMRPCPSCHGDGRHWISPYDTLDSDTGDWVHHRGRWQTCETCDGDGYDHVDTSAVRAMLRVSDEVWAALLADAYEAMYGWLRREHDAAKKTLVERVRETKTKTAR